MSGIETWIAKATELMKSPEARDKVTKDDIENVKTLASSIKTMNEFTDKIAFVYHSYRYLRNACIQCKKNQDLIVQSDILSVIKTLIEFSFDPTLETNYDDKSFIKNVKELSVQFLGNLVVQNKQAVKAVWNHCFPGVFFSMMSNFDGKGKDFVCMVIYNCWRESFSLIDKQDECYLMHSILDHCNEYELVEWGLLVLELVITSENFIVLYKELHDYPELRASLLDMLFSFLAEENSSNIFIPESNLIFLSEEFITKSSCMVMLAGQHSEEVLQESQIIFKILNVLSTATGIVEVYGALRSSEKLLKITVNILKGICACTEPVVTGTEQNDHHPMFNFKRNLVKMIANMAYENRLIQDKVREYDGITTVLNCSNIDHRNPYLMQWAIFAVRAICNGNVENQTLISGLENHGIATSLLSNVNAKLENGRIKISSRNNGN